jgi:hypothetical protein
MEHMTTDKFRKSAPALERSAVKGRNTRSKIRSCAKREGEELESKLSSLQLARRAQFVGAFLASVVNQHGVLP